MNAQGSYANQEYDLRHAYCIGGGRYCQPAPQIESRAALPPTCSICGGETEHDADAHAEEGRW